jgi:tetratricopeptide (TPR) repeat protein
MIMWSNYLNKFQIIILTTLAISSLQANARAIPQVWNVPAANPNFVGREKILESIGNVLKNTQLKVAVISGPSGFGKSQIAKKYVHQNYEHYDVIWWFKGNQYLDPQFESFALELDAFLDLGLGEKIKSIGHNRLVIIIKEAIRKKGIKCLLIFDDVQLFKDVESYVPFTHEMGIHTIVTTKNANFSDKALRLKPFHRSESIAYISQFLPDDEESKSNLARRLGDCPSSLAIAIDYIKNYPGMTIESYLEKHNTEAEFSSELLQDAAQRLGSPIDGYEMDLFKATKMNLQELKRTSRLAFQLVGFLSLLHHDALCIEDIKGWLKQKSSDQDVLELINIINRYSLIDSTTVDKKVYLNMQELIQKIVNAFISPEEKIGHLKEAEQLLSGFFTVRSDKVIEAIIKDNTFLLHTLKISEEANKIDYHSEKLTSLRIRVLDVLVGHLRDFDKARMIIDCLQKDFNSQIKISKEDDILYNTNLFLFSVVSSPDYEKAITFGAKALKLIESEEGMYEEKIRLFSNLIQYYSLIGLLDECQQFIQKGKEIFSLSESEAYNALYVYAITLFLLDKGEIDTTISHIRQHQGLLEKQDFYPSMRFFPLNQLAEAHIKKGDIEECKRVLCLAEKLGNDFYDNDENSFFGKLNVLKASCDFLRSGSFTTAKLLIEKSLNTYEQIYKGSDKHRNQAFAHMMFGKLYFLKNYHDEAKEHFLKSEMIYEKLLKNKKVQDVSELYKSLAILGVELKDEVLTHTYLKKHISTFGLEHSNSNEIMIYIDKKGLNLPF